MKAGAVLLLGGGGFIGCALAARLQQQGVLVHQIGRDKLDQLAVLLPQCGTVVHLASSTTPGLSARQPELEQANIDLTIRLIDQLRGLPPRHLLYFSSGGTVYGNPAQLPVPETAALAPLSPYGQAKVVQEGLCLSLREAGHAVTVLRPSNAYGPAQPQRPGFGLVRTLLQAAREGTQVEVWGDGQNVRDYIHVQDIAEAVARLIRQPRAQGIYNLGSGLGISVNDLTAMVERLSGKSLQVLRRPARPVDVRAVVLDIKQIHQSIAWRPEMLLEQSLAEIWRTDWA